MREILLDTSGYSAFMRGHAAVGEAVRQADLIAVNPIVLGELWTGFRRGNRLERNRAELKTFLSSPRVDVIDLDAETSVRYAAIVETLARAGTPIPTNDLWIAASAMQYGLSVVTTDDHFRRVSQILVEYFVP